MTGLVFDEERHEYWYDGRQLPSVTEITRFLNVDKMTPNIAARDAAAIRGTAVHEACELIDYGEDPEVIPEYAGYVTAYKAFLRDYQIKGWKGIELPMTNGSYAGTLDRWGMVDGVESIVDLKTTYTLHRPALSAQLTGYCNLLDRGYIRLYGLLLRKNGKYTLSEMPYSPDLWNACVTLHRALDTKGGKS
jgi:hypothetical protein